MQSELLFLSLSVFFCFCLFFFFFGMSFTVAKKKGHFSKTAGQKFFLILGGYIPDTVSDSDVLQILEN